MALLSAYIIAGHPLLAMSLACGETSNSSLDAEGFEEVEEFQELLERVRLSLAGLLH